MKKDITNRFLSLFFIVFFLLSACQANRSNELLEEQGKQTNIPLSTITKTSVPPSATSTITMIPTQTFTMVPPKSFDVSTIKTITPATPAECPVADPSIIFDVKELVKSDQTFSDDIPGEMDITLLLEYLNAGVSGEFIINKLQEEYKYYFDSYYLVDVTGDNTLEMVFPYELGVEIIGCYNYQYQVLANFSFVSSLLDPYFLYVQDVNQDGLSEISVFFDGCLGGRCPYFQIFAWDGSNFVDLTTDRCHGALETPFYIDVVDTDNNGTLEVVFRYEGGTWPTGSIGFPFRKEEIICMWNGNNYLVAENNYETPFYRWQAVSDGSSQMSVNNYEKALEFYQQAIDDISLEWFTEERNIIAYWKYMSEIWHDPSLEQIQPTNMKPSPDEYPNLAAYSYYRIVLLYLLQNKTKEAQATYSILLTEYPADKTGGDFTKMAEVLLSEYQKTQDIGLSCTEVVDYAYEHLVPLFVLGEYGTRSEYLRRFFEPMCPY